MAESSVVEHISQELTNAGIIYEPGFDGPHGEGVYIHEFEAYDPHPPGTGTRAYYEWERELPEGTLVYLDSAISTSFWPNLGFRSVFRTVDEVEHCDPDHAPLWFWNILNYYLVKRVGGEAPEPIVVTPQDF
jgi:hypothetical protein